MGVCPAKPPICSLGAMRSPEQADIGRETVRSLFFILLEDFGKGDLQAGEERGQGEFSRAKIALIFHPVDLDGLQFRVHNPILGDAVTLIKFALYYLIGLAGGLRENFNHKVWRSLDVLLGDDGRSPGRDEKEVGLNHVEIRKNHITWSGEDFSFFIFS